MHIKQKLMRLQEWRSTRFSGKLPSVSTVKRWARDGDIPAKKIGRTWYVILNEELSSTGDELVDAVLRSE